MRKFWKNDCFKIKRKLKLEKNVKNSQKEL